MRAILAILISLALLAGCVQPESQPQAGPAPSPPATAEDGPADVSDAQEPHAPTSAPTELIQPSDLTYLGAFRLPDVTGDSNWGYSGYAATFYPDGDPGGPDDGYPGSIFAIGHDHHQMVSEISIPAPVDSRDLDDLNTAATLQGFADITGGMYGPLEIPRAGLEYLSAQGQQATGKLYFAWGSHLEDEQAPTHGWAELDLSDPSPAGPWDVEGYTNYLTNDYMFGIPAAWAAENTPGKLLATGRFRDGLWSGRGPALFAIGPWNDGDPPARDSPIKATPLLLYGVQNPGALEIESDESMAMDGFGEADEWSGGAWLTYGDRSAMVLIGTKATGDNWYGFSNGVVYPVSGLPGEVYPDVPDWPHDSRGWWSDNISAQMLFFDPAELAAVAEGSMESWEPQPYAALAFDERLYDPGFDHERGKRYLVGAAAYDRENGILYIFEREADDDKSVVHAWRVT